MLLALEEGTLEPSDLKNLTAEFDTPDEMATDRPDMIQLESGLWIDKNDIVYEGLCQCERNTCVGHDHKVMCIFSKYLHEWVISRHLYWQCYDEQVDCQRCGEPHKRGHIGSDRFCGNPF